MISIHKKTLQDLEFTTVLNQVSEYAITELGHDKILQIYPYHTKDELIHALQLTNEYLASFDNNNRIPNHGFDAISKELQLLKIENTFLEVPSLKKLVSISQTINELIGFLKKFHEYYPFLNKFASQVEITTVIIDKVNATSAEKIESNDKDYVFIHFILNNLPRGLIGLLLAVILSAAMSSTASELNALASTTAIDLYKRNIKEERTEEHYVKASKWFTLAWGVLAILVACVANLFDNLIQLVNIIGSIFYGNVLGIFLLAFFVKFVKGNAVFIAAIITQIIIIVVFILDWLPYLWLNLLGCTLVMGIAVLIQMSNTKNSNLLRV